MNNKIQFILADDQTIELGDLNDCFASVFAIGALTATRKKGTDNETGYATDLNGLKKLLEHAEFERDSLLDMSKSLSLLLIKINGSSELETEKLLWMIHSLTGLVERITLFVDEISYALHQAEVQAIKNPD